MLASELHFRIVDPVTQLLACGDVGTGAMAAVSDIVAAVQAATGGEEVTVAASDVL